jgi:ribose transport system substrate-binding protein
MLLPGAPLGRRGPRALLLIVLLITLCGIRGASATGTDKPHAQKVYQIDLSMSYVGNDWQQEAENLVKAMALTAPYNKIVKLKVYIAGTSATRQIQQLDSMINAGVDAILVFPISPTALNSTITSACARGIKVFAYDAEVTAPCAYNVHINQTQAGRVTAQWLANELHGHGDIAMITGVPGTSVDTQRTAAALAVFHRYPKIHVVASVPGMWDQAVGKTALAQIYASHPHLDGLWMQVGCYSAVLLEQQTHKPIIPCAGESSNGHRFFMLPKSQGGIGLRSISYGSPPYSGALALKLAVKVLQGNTVPKLTILPLPVVTNANIKLGTDPAKGANVFPPKLVPPGFFADFYSPEVGLGLHAALTGKP